MSNNPILPIVPNGSGLIGANNDDGSEDLLPVNDPDLDEGETNDDRETVDEDIRESNEATENLEQ
jgi:hypothetical protein